MQACPRLLPEALEAVHRESLAEPCRGFSLLVTCTASVALRLAGREPPPGPLGVSITEPRGGSDPGRPETRARLLPGAEALVTGEKVFTTNGLTASRLLVHAADEETGDPVLVLVDPARGGVEAEPMGLAAYSCSGVARVRYREARGELVAGPGRAAYKLLLEALARSRLLVAAHAAALAEKIVGETAGELMRRGAWRHQPPRHRLAAALAKAWAALSLAREEAAAAETRGTVDWARSSAAKYLAAEAALEALEAAARGLGGYAALPDRPTLRYAAEAFSLLAAEGTQDIQLEIISRSLAAAGERKPSS